MNISIRGVHGVARIASVLSQWDSVESRLVGNVRLNCVLFKASSLRALLRTRTLRIDPGRTKTNCPAIALGSFTTEYYGRINARLDNLRL